MTSNQFGENDSTQFKSLLEHGTAQPEYTPDIAAIDLPKASMCLALASRRRTPSALFLSAFIKQCAADRRKLHTS